MERIAKYELREELGRGGMGVVYRAYDTLMDRQVAIKVILAKALELEETKARFIREARVAGKLSQENITVIYDLGEYEGQTYIVMEYLQGRDLRSIIDNKEALTLQQKLDYARQICRGLEYAHANNVIHRDIKPENIKVLDNARIKIIDFGIAKPYMASATEGDADGMTEVALTRAGMRIGTPWYMSPEQVKGIPVDKRADIFSFGVLLYELLTYKRPFDGDDTTVLYKILHEEPDPIHLEGSGLSNDLQAILSRCLAKDPDDRYPDCSAVLKDLNLIPDRVKDERKIRELLTEAEGLADQKQYAEATVKFNEVLAIDPVNTEAATYLKRLIDRNKESATIRVLTGKIVGDIISHFQILERIGGGGMGVVYKAEDFTLKRIVALKFLLPDLTRDSMAKKRFLKEAQAASALDHPNICAIHEISETEEGLIFICMAYYGGENLSKRIAGGPLPTEDAVDTVTRIARGLSKAHGNGIVHRDIKPANIIITSDGEVKIVDFGLAKLSGGTRITKIGSTMGTLPYMSPEQVRGLEVDHRTDIWSLGVLLYQILTGKLPFRGDYEAAVLFAIVNEQPPPITEVRKGIPPEIGGIIDKSLKKDARDRYASMQELLSDLEKLGFERRREGALVRSRTTEVVRLIDDGKRAVERGEYELALTMFTNALRIAPGDREILELREDCQRRLDERKQIRELLDEAKALIGKGKLREAEGALKAATALNPREADAAELLGFVRKEIERIEQRDRLATDAEFYLEHEKYDEAATAYRKLLQVDPANKDAAKGLIKVEKARGHKTQREQARTPIPGARARARRRNWVVAGIGLVAVGSVTVWLILHSGRPTTAVDVRQTQMDSSAVAANREVPGARQHPVNTPPAPIHAETRDSIETSPASGAPSDLAALKQEVELARDDMRAAKSAAISAGGKSVSPDLFREASKAESKGESQRGSELKETLLAAKALFTNARDTYRIIESRATLLAQSRREADVQRDQMNRTKQSLPGTEKERKTNSSYRKATDSENAATKLYNTGNYSAARDAFASARDLYAGAGNELRSLAAADRPTAELEKRTTAKADIKEPERKVEEKKDPAKSEAEDLDAARQSIHQMIERYKANLEKGDVNGLSSLTNLNKDQQNVWSSLFSSSEGRKVTVDNISISSLTRENARVTFRTRMSFYNSSANRTQDLEVQENWALERDNAGWKVVQPK